MPPHNGIVCVASQYSSRLVGFKNIVQAFQRHSSSPFMSNFGFLQHRRSLLSKLCDYTHFDMEVNKLNFAIGVAAMVVAYWLYRAFYNLYLHPLAKIPGPWWAAMSYLPEIYYDVIKGGRYWSQVVEMHEKYGEGMTSGTSHLTQG
jgi:hypothetical protein